MLASDYEPLTPAFSGFLIPSADSRLPKTYSPLKVQPGGSAVQGQVGDYEHGMGPL